MEPRTSHENQRLEHKISGQIIIFKDIVGSEKMGVTIRISIDISQNHTYLTLILELNMRWNLLGDESSRVMFFDWKN